MKQLVCEICESGNIIKQDGVFVCQDCGCKYSVEEVKSLIIDGNLKIDKSAEKENFIVLMEEARKAAKEAEVYDYAEKILQIDIKHKGAWMQKSWAAGWLSELNNVRFKESILCFEKALELAENEEEASEIRQKFINEYLHMTKSTYTWICNNYAKHPNHKSHKNNVINAARIYSDTIKELKEKYFSGLDVKKLLTDCSTEIFRVCKEGMSKANKDFGIMPVNEFHRSNRYEYENYISTCINIIEIFDFSQNLIEDIGLLESLKQTVTTYTETLVNSYSTERQGTRYVKDLSLTEEAKKINQDNHVRIYKQIEAKIERIKKEQEEAQEKRNQEYWEKHKEEKTAFEDELKSLGAKIGDLKVKKETTAGKINQLKEKISQVLPEEKAANNQDNVIRNLERDYSECGIFKGKEKKAILQKLEEEKPKQTSLRETARKTREAFDSKTNLEISKLNTELKEIKKELANSLAREQEITNELNKAR